MMTADVYAYTNRVVRIGARREEYSWSENVQMEFGYIFRATLIPSFWKGS